MQRIVALNEEVDDSGDEVQATKEAQGAIAESEFLRAVKFKAQGKVDCALTLFNELVETKVLSEITADKEHEKLWTIRYNCLKNIAIIHEERGESEVALAKYMQVMEIDESDVYTMHRFGQLALKVNALELAEKAFLSCLRRNPRHWLASDGMLQTLCRSHNILGACGWALSVHRRDARDKRAVNTLKVLMTTFKHMIPFYEKFWGPFPLDAICENEIGESVFPPSAATDQTESQTVKLPTSIRRYKLRELTWLTLGQYILMVYKHLHETNQCLFFAMKFEDLFCDSELQQDHPLAPEEQQTNGDNDNSSNSTSMDIAAIAQCHNGKVDVTEAIGASSPSATPGAPDCHASIFATPEVLDHADGFAKSQSQSTEATKPEEVGYAREVEPTKPKPRRRCSDLLFLEQWGWHKNRRYARKKSQPERVESDNTLNSFLRRIFVKFTETTFEMNWPFGQNETGNSCSDIIEKKCTQCAKTLNLEDFQGETQNHFDKMVSKLKGKPFDMMVLIYKWLKYMSRCWQRRLPSELSSTYLQLFDCYIKHFDFSTWHQMSNNNYEASYSLCLLYLELDFARTAHSDTMLSEQWWSIFNNLQFNAGYAYVACNKSYIESFELRYCNLKYLCHMQRTDSAEQTLNCLRQMGDMLNERPSIELHLPNLQTFCPTKDNVMARYMQLQRQIELNRVPHLFGAKEWSDLVKILQNNINCSRECHDNESWTKDFKTQIEVLLQALFELTQYEECLLWSEKFLHYTSMQYLENAKNTYRQKFWAESINYIFSYLEALLLNEGFHIVSVLGDHLSRLVQNVIRLLTHQLDAPFDKNNNAVHDLEIKRPWVVLHQILVGVESQNPVVVKNKLVTSNGSAGDSEEDEELIPNTFMLLFTAHEFLGKRQWCTRDGGSLLQYILDTVTPNLRAPLYDACREAVNEYVEQLTLCLFGYPQKKARSRHLEEHDATQIELTWPRALRLFDLYRPECLPEFNSYKLESITSDMEQLLLKIVALIPKELDPTPYAMKITDFINGDAALQEAILPTKFSYKINSLFYLLADFYFKNRDFLRAIKYYTLDLVINSKRFDSWAGMALSKASKVETKLNALVSTKLSVVLSECEDTLRCFEQCINLNRNQTLLWIEYGSFAYTMHAHCSRFINQFNDKVPLEEKSLAKERKERMLNIAYNCFTFAGTLQNLNVECNSDDNGEIHDEKWLCQFMLGKITEKRKDEAKIYINYYLTAANHLYENGATYPIKINHSNPTTLSIEALEVFYRTNAAIIKYLERNRIVSRELGDYFIYVLRNLASSPFAFNKAKIDGNSLNVLKRKSCDKIESVTPVKIVLNNVLQVNNSQIATTEAESNEMDLGSTNNSNNNNGMAVKLRDEPKKSIQISPSRRESQESTLTGITTTTVTSSTTTSSSTTTTSSSDSSTSTDSDSDSDVSSNERLSAAMKKENIDKNAPYSDQELLDVYKIVVHNLEECVTRFPEHYKSNYRLTYHYMHAPAPMCALHRCEQLLLNQYRTNLGNQINGLFYDRKTNNLFNGIWRIPSSEIDRPGSFSTHLVKCVRILIELLLRQQNYVMLIDIGLQLYRTPDNDKRYIKDNERLELYQLAINFSAQILRQQLNDNMQRRDDVVLIDMLIDIYKIHKKCFKYMNQREPFFTQLLIEVYRFYIKDKVDVVPENLNFFDLAIKLCLQELSVRKNMEKANTISGGNTFISPTGTGVMGVGSMATGIINVGNSLSDALVGFTSTAPRTIPIPGLIARPRNRNSGGNKSTTTNFLPEVNATPMMPAIPAVASNSFITDVLQSPNFMSMISSLNASSVVQKDSVGFQTLVAEYYNQIMENSQRTGIPPSAVGANGAAALLLPPPKSTFPLVTSLPVETTITPSQLPPQMNKSNTSIQVAATAPLQSSNFEVTIMPAVTSSSNIIPPVSIIPVPVPSQNTSNEVPTAGDTATATHNVSGSIFVKPLINMQEMKYAMPLPDLPDSLTITTLPKAKEAAMQNPNSIGSTACVTVKAGVDVEIKASTKAKSAYRSKPSTTRKPYSRSLQVNATLASEIIPAIPAAIADLKKLSTLNGTMEPDAYKKHMSLIATYTDFLNNTPLDQFRYLSQKFKNAPAPSNVRAGSGKSKASNPTEKLTTIGAPASAPANGPNAHSPFAFSAFDANTITMTPLPNLSLGKRSSPSLTKAATSSPPLFSPLAPLATPPLISPTKTLQQKLAERQKANLLSEATSGCIGPKAAVNKTPNVDVIILD